MNEGKKYTVVFTEYEVQHLLSILGKEQQRRYDTGQKSKGVGFLIDKLYRSMGVNLNK